MVRRYILTQSERKILRRYIETGEEFTRLHSILRRLQESQYLLTHDLEIITEALKKRNQTQAN